MVDRWSESLFRAAALTSGLVEPQIIDEAIERLSLADNDKPNEPPAAFSDENLANQLIELGYLNLWQVEQLKAGRTRFRLGDYQIVDSIGQGGMGQVFKATHTLLGRVEAIKVLPRSKSTPEAIECFRREIRAQAQLDHPNLVRVSYAGFDGNVYFLVTEYVPGADLRQLVRTNGKLNMQQAASIMLQAAEGLRYIHENGLIHRDVKPGNLLVTPDGHTKVSDMGLFGFTTGSDGEDPREGKIVGTADYLSPEQILAPRSVTPAADVYSLGCTLYYAISGKVPYPGGTTKEKAHRHCNDTPLHPRHFNESLSDEFVEVIADMMEKRPSDRIATAEEVVGRLSPWLGEVETIGPAVRMSRRLAAPPPAPQRGKSDLADTNSNMFDFPNTATGPDDANGQQSQGTDPNAQFEQETQDVALPAGTKAAKPHAAEGQASVAEQGLAGASETPEMALPADKQAESADATNLSQPPTAASSQGVSSEAESLKGTVSDVVSDKGPASPPPVPPQNAATSTIANDQPAPKKSTLKQDLTDRFRRLTIPNWVRAVSKWTRQRVSVLPRIARALARQTQNTYRTLVSIPTLLKVSITIAVTVASIVVTLLFIYFS